MMDHHLGENWEAYPWFEQADAPHLLLLLQPHGLLAGQRFEYAALCASLVQQPHCGSLVQQPHAALVQQQLAIVASMQEECTYRTSPDQPSGFPAWKALRQGAQHRQMPL